MQQGGVDIVIRQQGAEGVKAPGIVGDVFHMSLDREAKIPFR
jgi:hypothetical protein